MSKVLGPLSLFCLVTIVRPPLWAQVDRSVHSAPALKELVRYEPTGLSLLHPYVRGKVPVVFVHGLWASPWTWHRMIESLEADPAVKGGFQFWTFGYSTGDPIPYSSHLFRRNLDEARQKLDPNKADPAFDRMVIVGHSMGGLVAKMISVDSGDRLWRVVTDRPFRELIGEEDDRKLFHGGLIFDAYPSVRRVVYIATPHRGSRFDQGSIQKLGSRLIRLPDPLRAAHQRLVAQNQPNFFRDYFRKGLPSSVDELEWGSPILAGLADLSQSPAVKAHSIIPVRADSPPDRRTDGLVNYESAHVKGVASEKIVSAGHLCQDHSEVIAEVRRILSEHKEITNSRPKTQAPGYPDGKR
jgi:pimeloyl-ACP methyl ester carboxylesterase